MANRKTAKAVAAYRGGVMSLVEAAVSETGNVFKRYQEKTPRGYRWGGWKNAGLVADPKNPPAAIESGFSNLYPDRGEAWKRYRLPA
jgi:hypothetical protein